MGFQGFRQGIYRRQKEERKTFPLSQTVLLSANIRKGASYSHKDQRRHPHKRQPSPFPIRAPRESAGKAKWKCETESHKSGESFPAQLLLIGGTVQSAQSNLTGFPNSPQERVRWNWGRRSSFSIRLTISIRNNRSRYIAYRVIFAHHTFGVLKSILFLCSPQPIRI